MQKWHISFRMMISNVTVVYVGICRLRQTKIYLAVCVSGSNLFCSCFHACFI